tara:strand:- start:1157 stop:1270 length:114 start_codon:yes stop_codon:yes gene_type:complete
VVTHPVTDLTPLVVAVVPVLKVKTNVIQIVVVMVDKE